MNRRKADWALLFNTVVWGATFVLVKSALYDISPILFLALRFALATWRSDGLFRGRARLGGPGRPSRPDRSPDLSCCRICPTDHGASSDHAPKSAFLTGLTSLLVPLLGVSRL